MIYSIALDSLAIEIEYAAQEVGALLDFLLSDIRSEASAGHEVVACFSFSSTTQGWLLAEQGGPLAARQLQLVDLALILLNVIMLRFAAHNQRSLALHAALVSDSEGSILLPGATGVGKSNACLWLSHLGMYYHTDEMVTINRETSEIAALVRPYTLKQPLLQALQEQIIASSRHCPVVKEGEGAKEGEGTKQYEGKRTPVKGAVNWPVLESRANLWLAHRAVNPDFQRAIPPLKAIVFPLYSVAEINSLTKISSARAAMELMRNQFQGQRFEDHGFVVISKLLRTVPAYMLVYHRFEQLRSLLAPLILVHDDI